MILGSDGYPAVRVFSEALLRKLADDLALSGCMTPMLYGPDDKKLPPPALTLAPRADYMADVMGSRYPALSCRIESA